MEEGKTVRLVFGYQGGEKSVITAENITKEDLHAIAKAIADSKSEFVVIDIPTKKGDIILINKQYLVFYYATPDESGKKAIKR